MPSTFDDERFLGLTAGDDGRTEVTLTDELCRLDGRLYGGTAIAVSCATARAATGRPPTWITTQFIAGAPRGAQLSVQATELARGGRTSQIRVDATAENGSLVFTSMGAACIPRPNGLTATFERMPDVAPPSSSEAPGNPFAPLARSVGYSGTLPDLGGKVGYYRVLEYRTPDLLEDPSNPGQICMWVRRRDGVALSPAIAAFAADMVPLGISQGTRTLAVGISLDNTVRFGEAEPTEWVLIDVRPHLVSHGFGHGNAYMWNEHGELLGVASQIASMVGFDPSGFGSPT